MPSRSEQTKMVYYALEIRDMRNIPSCTPQSPGECPNFSCGNNSRIFLALFPSRELIECQIP